MQDVPFLLCFGDVQNYVGRERSPGEEGRQCRTPRLKRRLGHASMPCLGHSLDSIPAEEVSRFPASNRARKESLNILAIMDMQAFPACPEVGKHRPSPHHAFKNIDAWFRRYTDGAPFVVSH